MAHALHTSIAPKLLAMSYVFFSIPPALADVPGVQCRVIDDQGTEVVSFRPLYTSKRTSLKRIDQDKFIDLRYRPFTATVSVTMLRMPHYPWTFLEKLIGQSVLHMEPGVSGPVGISIDPVKPSAQLICRELAN